MNKIVIGIDAPGRLSTKGVGKGAFGGWAAYSLEERKFLGMKQWEFGVGMSEIEAYEEITNQLDWITAHTVDDVVLAIEQPFLWAITQWIGGFKMWCAIRGSSWWMVSSPMARKLVLGSGRTGKGLAKENKLKVLAAMKAHVKQHVILTQHEADAMLYALAYEVWCRQQEEAKSCLKRSQ